MTINTKTVLKNLKGEDMKEGNNMPLTIGLLIANILGGITANPSLAWQLGKKFATEEKVELKAEQIVFLKEEINKVASGEKAWLNSMIAGQILELLEK
jgi:hypothetical protein